jgi:hypothetical protein
MSVNHRRMKRMSCSATSALTSSTERGWSGMRGTLAGVVRAPGCRGASWDRRSCGGGRAGLRG